jgi:hypothetical protein
VAAPGHIYHWKHGWIPITPRAAMIKAKGSHSLGERYMHRYGVHDSRVGEAERRTERVGEGPGGRGSFRYVKGTKTRDYPDRAPSGSAPEAKDLHPDVAFRMKKPELEHHAKAGSKVAQAELDRRAARTKAAGGKVGGKREAPFRPTAEPKPAPEAPKAAEPKPAPEAPKAAEPKPAPEVPEVHNPEVRVKAARDAYGADSPEHKAALEEQDRYINSGLGLWPSAGPGHQVKATVAANYSSTRQPDGSWKHERKSVVVSSHYDRNGTGAYAYRPIGTVRENEDGTFTATRHTYTPKTRKQRDHPVGYNAQGEKGKVFANREEAHKALATEHTIAQTKNTEKERKKAEAAAKVEAERRRAVEAESHTAAAQREANNRALTGLAGPHGTTWEPMPLPAAPAGAPIGVAEGVNNVGYAMKAGKATVLINKDITPDRAKLLLANVSKAMERVEPNLPAHTTNVTFNVPKDLPYFANKPNTGAFVLAGDTTVTINPRMVSGEQWAGFEHAGHVGHFMPASTKGQDVQEYTLVHELGHVIDGQHRHTRPQLAEGNFNHDYSNVQFHRTTTRGAGAYAQDNPAEGYAEAFAQHTLGGTGSHPVAASYAERFGWKDAGTPSAVHNLTRDSAHAERLSYQRRQLGLQDAASTTSYRLSDAQKVQNAAVMHGTGSRQHKAAMARFGTGR